MIVAIHQPNFFPWLGYFDKIRLADAFVFLDGVQFPKTGSGTWTNRVMIRIGDAAAWVVCPIQRPSGTFPISEVRIADNQPWRAKLLRTIENNYRRSKFFSEAYPLIQPLVEYRCDLLSQYNCHTILTLTKALGIQTNFALQTELDVTGASTELLINITRRVGGDTYMTGGGATGYQKDEMFEASSLRAVHQSFSHPTYIQHGKQNFVPGLSIIDSLMNLGVQGTSDLLGVGRP